MKKKNSDKGEKHTVWHLVSGENISIMKAAGLSATRFWLALPPRAFCPGSSRRSSLRSAGRPVFSPWRPVARPEWRSCRSPLWLSADCVRATPRPPDCCPWCGSSFPDAGSAASCSSAVQGARPGLWRVHSRKESTTKGWDTWETQNEVYHEVKVFHLSSVVPEDKV